MRSLLPFPAEFNTPPCAYIQKLWEDGWLDEFSDDHFIIKALERRLNSFNWDQQFINNNCHAFYSALDKDGQIDYDAFSYNFCTNLSARLSFMENIFGERTAKQFIKNQLSAGKSNYNEDAFFQAFSEVEILTFFHRGFEWEEVRYEPPIGSTGANPEASFVGDLCDVGSELPVRVKVNIEVKTPKFPRIDMHNTMRAIPSILLSNAGRSEVARMCESYNIKLTYPRITKLVEFINSACKKFDFPKENEYNLLYINWAYCDFPSVAFLEAWSLLTNDFNGLLRYPQVATTLPLKEPVLTEAYKKITAVIVYTSSLDQLMFCDFRHVWQRTNDGCKFRMFVLDEKIRTAELNNTSNLLFQLTGMHPDRPQTKAALFSCASKSIEERITNNRIATDLASVIIQNALTETNN